MGFREAGVLFCGGVASMPKISPTNLWGSNLPLIEEGCQVSHQVGQQGLQNISREDWGDINYGLNTL